MSTRLAKRLFTLLAALGSAAALADFTPLPDVSATAAGESHACAISAGAAYCWGRNGAEGKLGNGSTADSPSPVPVTGLGAGVTAIAAGVGHACAVVNGAARCWGDNANGQLGNGGTTPSSTPVAVSGLSSGVTAIAAGGFHTCAVVNGSVRCWGMGSAGQLGHGASPGTPVTAPVSTNIASGATAVAAGRFHTCAIVNGGARCWGANYQGQVGNNGSTASVFSSPQNVAGISAGGSGVTAIAAGPRHTCAAVAGNVNCWGLNASGQLGNLSTVNATGPVSVNPALSGVTAVAAGGMEIGAGGGHGCAVVAGGAMRCWGDNTYRQLGMASPASSTSPLLLASPPSGATKVSAGGSHTCAVVGTAPNAAVQCFGRNQAGQLGNGFTSLLASPIAAAPLTSGASALASGSRHSCAVAGGQVRCWGTNEAGQLGNGTTVDSATPVTVSGIPSGATAVSGGAQHTCAVVNGGVKCWGANGNGRLGDNSTSPSSVPVTAIAEGSGATAVAAGGSHTCAVVANAGSTTVRCWGLNGDGQLGDNTITQRLVPTPTAGASTAGAVALAAGIAHTCAVIQDGALKCWGRNLNGQLGLAGTADRLQATLVTGLLSGVSGVAAGSDHTCVIANGAATCFGFNGSGQLGNNSDVTPALGTRVTPVGLTSGVTALAGGHAHTCAVVDGGLQCWGDGTKGQLGTGTTATALAPVGAAGLSGGVTAVAAGLEHTCALVGGGVTCFGSGDRGELGSPTFSSVATPATVRTGGTSAASLLSARNPAEAGQPLTLTATVAFNATSPSPAGTVAFRDGASPIAGCGAVALSGSGIVRTATCTTSALPQGTRTLTAAYSGDATYAAGTSAALAQEVVVTTPAGLAFAHQTQVAPGALATSNAVVVTGITVSVPIAVAGGQYSLGCSGAFTTAPGSVSPGATVCVRHVTPLAFGATTTTTLTVGGGQAAFNSTTALASATVQPATISAGTSHTLVVTPAGQVWGWGDNTSGKLGNGNTAASTIPVRAQGLDGVIAVAAGMSHSLALEADGTVWAWGLNTDGQLGIGPASPTTCTIPNEFNAFCALVPQPVPGLSDVVAVSAGWRHSLALKRDGTVWGWGSAFNGQNGSNGNENTPTLVPIAGTVTRIAAGYMHSVALLDDGTVLAWGRGNEGELGPALPNGSTQTPTLVTGLSGVTDIAAGGAFSLARKADGSLHAWGSNIYGNLGDASVPTGNGFGGTGFRAAPAVVQGMAGGVAEFSAGFGFALVRKTDGTAWSWGLDNAGQLGNGGAAPELCGRAVTPNRPCVKQPAPIAAHDGALRLVAGGAHGLALRPDGAFATFGDNAWGQRGDKSPNWGAVFAQTTYDPDFSLIPAGTFGTPTGVGQPSGGKLNLNAMDNGLDFGAQGVGISTAPVAITVTNLGDDSVTITAVGVAGDAVPGEFSKSSDGCQGTTLNNGASCDVGIVFTPGAFGARSGTLSIQSNAADTPSASYGLSGTGADTRVASAVTLASSSATSLFNTAVTFTATVAATGATPSGTVAFTESGAPLAGCAAVPVNFGSAACATAALAPGAHAIVAAYSGDASVQASASAPFVQTVVATPAPMSALPASLDFGGQSMNTTAPARSVTFTNTGASPLVVTSLTPPAHFGASHDCGALAAGASCTASVTFTPGAEGALAGSLLLQSDAGVLAFPLAGTGERSLVTHYYRSILRRDPDAGGKAFWTGEAARVGALGLNPNEVWFALSAAFFTSAEYLAFARGDTGFVTDLYNTFFNRAPDAPGLAFWTGQLASGLPREVALSAFMFSAEFVNFSQAIFGATAVRAEIDTVTDFYRGLLSRLPDNGGFAFWLARFRAAQCLGGNAVNAEVEAISSLFANSAEYANRARTNAQYVGDLYNAFLRRGGDLPGVLFWINEIASGARTRENVRQAFVASPEFQFRIAAIISQGCLP